MEAPCCRLAAVSVLAVILILVVVLVAVLVLVVVLILVLVIHRNVLLNSFLQSKLLP